MILIDICREGKVFAHQSLEGSPKKLAHPTF
jgi:hypothetical protein